MGVPDGPCGPAGADDLRHIERLGVFWAVVEAWRVDRPVMIGQGRGDRERGPRRTGRPYILQGRGRVTPNIQFSTRRRIASALLVGTILGGIAAPAAAARQAQPAPAQQATAPAAPAAAPAAAPPAVAPAPAPVRAIQTLSVT